MHAPVVTTGRDLRLDLFRGIALWLIFLDHIPSNVVSWITIRNYGFSDATEIFIFISGYTAAFVYGRAMRERGFVVAGARILRRAWQIYVAHIFLFAIYMAEISYVATSFDNPLYAEEMNILDFLKQPDMTIVQALLLKFKPVNMDILPLYIILLAAVPADPVAPAARPDAGARRLARALCAGLAVRLESARLSGRLLVLQSVRLAASCSCSAPGARSAAPIGSRRSCDRRLTLVHRDRSISDSPSSSRCRGICRSRSASFRIGSRT